MRRPFLLALLCLIAILSRGEVFTHKQLTNLPTVYVETFDGQDITSKEVYKYARMTYVDGDSVAVYDSLKIRGRGNGAWVWAKKPYRLKFNDKVKLLGHGHANAKNWTILANHADKAMIRNALTTRLGELVGLPFSPGARFVDFYLNGSYLGTYQISDQVEIKKHRVDIYEQEDSVTSDTTNVTGGYLLEVDGYSDAGETYFSTTKENVHIRIHEPKPELINYRQFNYIKQYVNQFEAALFSDKFTDAAAGYRPYVDTTSLVNWYIATEVCANMDAYWSTYCYKDKNDPKIYFGPLWDLDIAYNNCKRIGDVTTSMMADVAFGASLTKLWVRQFWNDPWFVEAVNRRYAELQASGLDSALVHCVDSLAQHIYRSQAENYKIWSINTRVHDEIKLFDTFDEYVADLRNFIPKHNAYLRTAFASHTVLGPTPAFVEDENRYYRIFNKGFSAGVFDVTNSVKTPGATVCIYEATSGRTSQQWQLKGVGQYFMIINRNSQLALYDPSKDAATYAQLTTLTPDSTNRRQLWQILPQSGGYYNIKNVVTTHTANNRGSVAANGNAILGYISSNEDATSKNRLWKIEADSLINETPDAIHSLQSVDYALVYSPSQQVLRFIAPEPEELTFEAIVSDLSGGYHFQFTANETCNVNQLPRGTYIVTWTLAGRRHSVKFLKQ